MVKKDKTKEVKKKDSKVVKTKKVTKKEKRRVGAGFSRREIVQRIRAFDKRRGTAVFSRNAEQYLGVIVGKRGGKSASIDGGAFDRSRYRNRVPGLGGTL